MILLVIAGLYLTCFLTPGRECSWSIWKIHDHAGRTAQCGADDQSGMVYLIMGSSVMTLTTTPNQLTDGLEKALKPLSEDQ